MFDDPRWGDDPATATMIFATRSTTAIGTTMMAVRGDN